VNNLNEIEAGWDAYGNDGQKIGSIYDRAENYIVVEKGVFFPKDIYVPADAIERADPDEQRVYLSVAKNDVESMGWDEPTAGRAETGESQGLGTMQSQDRTSSESLRVPVHEESLQAAKRTQSAGEVAVNTRVTEREESLDVPVTREQVDVRRVAVDRPAAQDERAFADGGTIRVPITEEQVEVTKTPRVVEEIEVSKRPVTETRRVSDTVRREEVDVQGAGSGMASGGSRSSSRESQPAGTMATSRAGYGTDGDDYAEGDDEAAEVAGGGMGAVGGAAVGAAVGGPVGAAAGGVIGAAAGAVTGKGAEEATDEEDDEDIR
jgi:uncharacterized protein (TIGR02271 family)